MKLPILRTCIALMLSAATTSFAADAAYRSDMPDGSVRYGESPERGARRVKKIAPPPASTGTALVTPTEKHKASQHKLETGGGVVLPRTRRDRPQPARAGASQVPPELPSRTAVD
jgi:hypothetical protein